MRVDDLRLKPRLRAWVYGTIGALFLTGLVWWLLDRWGRVETEFGDVTHPAAPWLMRAHGAAAMLMLVVVGVLVPLHVRRGWHARRNRGSGAGLVGALGVLAITGWLLYYAGGTQSREIASVSHVWLGFALPLAIFGHIWLGRRSRVAKDRPQGQTSRSKNR